MVVFITIFSGGYMNKIKFLASVSIVTALLLGGCSNDKAENAVPSTTPTSTEDTKAADFWTVIDGVTWTDNFEGLQTTIEKVVVSDKVPMTDGSILSAVGLRINIENTTKETFTTYPNQATLVTSTGEQIEADWNQSDNLGGEIYEGVVKEGDVVFFLKNGHAEDIKWITLKWLAHKGGDSEITQYNQNKYDVKIEF